MKRYIPLFALQEGKKQATQRLLKYMDKRKAKDVLNAYDRFDPTKSKKYIELLTIIFINDYLMDSTRDATLLVREFVNDILKKPDLNLDLESIELRQQKLDIHKIKTLKQLQQEIKKLLAVKTKSHYKGGIHKLKEETDYTILEYKSEKYPNAFAVVPLNFKASGLIASASTYNSKAFWCIADDEDYWNDYNSQGYQFAYLIDPDNNFKKFAVGITNDGGDSLCYTFNDDETAQSSIEDETDFDIRDILYDLSSNYYDIEYSLRSMYLTFPFTPWQEKIITGDMFYDDTKINNLSFEEKFELLTEEGDPDIIEELFPNGLDYSENVTKAIQILIKVDQELHQGLNLEEFKEEFTEEIEGILNQTLDADDLFSEEGITIQIEDQEMYQNYGCSIEDNNREYDYILDNAESMYTGREFIVDTPEIVGKALERLKEVI